MELQRPDTTAEHADLRPDPAYLAQMTARPEETAAANSNLHEEERHPVSVFEVVACVPCFAHGRKSTIVVPDLVFWLATNGCHCQ